MLNEPFCAERQFLIQLWLFLKTERTGTIQTETQTVQEPRVRAARGFQGLQVPNSLEIQKDVWLGVVPALRLLKHHQIQGPLKVRHFWGRGISWQVSVRFKVTTQISWCLISPSNHNFSLQKSPNLFRYSLAIVPDHHTISVKYEVPGRGRIGRLIRKIWNCNIGTTK